MTDEIKKESRVQIDVPEIETWQEALAFIQSGLSFLITNYKKTTIALIIIIVFVLYQLVMNFQQVRELLNILPQ